jgi:hypothetical protein
MEMPMKHRGLDIAGIQNLVAEAKTLEAVDPALWRMLGNVDYEISRRFNTGKKMSGPHLYAVASYARHQINTKAAIINARELRSEPSRTRPKGEEFECCYTGVHLMDEQPAGMDDVYQLFSLRFHMSRKAAKIEYIRQPLAFRYHAAERFLERTLNEDKAFMNIAMSLSKWSPVIHSSQAKIIEQTGSNFGFPSEGDEGLILGEYIAWPSQDAKIVTYDRHCRSIDSEPNYMETLYLARTFVDKFQLRCPQTDYVETVSAWGKANLVDMDSAREQIMWPHSSNNSERRELGNATDDIIEAILRLRDRDGPSPLSGR